MRSSKEVEELREERKFWGNTSFAIVLALLLILSTLLAIAGMIAPNF